MRDVQLVPHLRTIHRKLAAREAQLRADVTAGARTATFVEAEIVRLREAALAEAEVAAIPVLIQVREERSARAKWLPDPRDPDSVMRLAELHRSRRPKATLPDGPRLEGTPLPELLRQARETEDAVLLAEIHRICGDRRAKGQDDLGALPEQMLTRLVVLLEASPDTRQRREEHDAFALLEERAADTMNAIREGGEDLGRRYDAYAVIRQQVDAGERTGPIDASEVAAIAASLP